MIPWNVFAAGLVIGAALFGDGVRLPVWVRWFFVTLAIANLWTGSL